MGSRGWLGREFLTLGQVQELTSPPSASTLPMTCQLSIHHLLRHSGWSHSTSTHTILTPTLTQPTRARPVSRGLSSTMKRKIANPYWHSEKGPYCTWKEIVMPS